MTHWNLRRESTQLKTTVWSRGGIRQRFLQMEFLARIFADWPPRPKKTNFFECAQGIDW